MISDQPSQELMASGVGLPARSARRMRIAQTVMRKASTAIPAATRNPREKPTDRAWRKFVAAADPPECRMFAGVRLG
jgi:hypothetical protein